MHRKIGDYDPSRPVRPWLFAFAYRVASHYRRAEGRRREVAGVDVSVEEREALAIQALVNAGRHDEARARAAAFRERWPGSVYLPAVDTTLRSIP